MGTAKRKKCDCRICSLDRHAVIDLYRPLIGASYTREEFWAVVRWSKAAMLPRDGG